jgi:hypothetical protein
LHCGAADFFGFFGELGRGEGDAVDAVASCFAAGYHQNVSCLGFLLVLVKRQ